MARTFAAHVVTRALRRPPDRQIGLAGLEHLVRRFSGALARPPVQGHEDVTAPEAILGLGNGNLKRRRQRRGEGKQVGSLERRGSGIQERDGTRSEPTSPRTSEMAGNDVR